jgi:hypothetical protein
VNATDAYAVHFLFQQRLRRIKESEDKIYFKEARIQIKKVREDFTMNWCSEIVSADWRV